MRTAATTRCRTPGSACGRRLIYPDLRLHDLRHSFASFAIADGQSSFMVAKLLGHKDTRTTERYAHLAADPILATADRIAAAMRERGNLDLGVAASPRTGPEPNNPKRSEPRCFWTVNAVSV